MNTETITLTDAKAHLTRAAIRKDYDTAMTTTLDAWKARVFPEHLDAAVGVILVCHAEGMLTAERCVEELVTILEVTQ